MRIIVRLKTKNKKKN